MCFEKCMGDVNDIDDSKRTTSADKTVTYEDKHTKLGNVKIKQVVKNVLVSTNSTISNKVNLVTDKTKHL